MSYLDKYTILESFHKNSLQHIQMGYLKQDPSQIVVINSLFLQTKLPLTDIRSALDCFTSYLDFESTDNALVFVTLYNEGHAIEKYIENFPLPLEVRLSIAHQLFELFRRYVSLPLYIQDKLMDASHMIVAKEHLYHNELLLFDEDYVLPQDFYTLSIRFGKLLAFIVPDISDRHAQSFYTIIDDLLQGNIFADLNTVVKTYDQIAAKHKQTVTPGIIPVVSTDAAKTDVWTPFQVSSVQAPPIHHIAASPLFPGEIKLSNASEKLEQSHSVKKEKDLPDDFPFKDIVIPSFIKNVDPKVTQGISAQENTPTVENDITERLYENTDPMVENLVPLNHEQPNKTVTTDTVQPILIETQDDDLFENASESDSTIEAVTMASDSMTDDQLNATESIESIHLQIDDRLEIEARRKKRLWLFLIPLLLVLSTLLGFVLLNPNQVKAYDAPTAQFTQSKIGDDWYFENLSISDPLLTLTAHYWTVTKEGSTLFTTTDKDLTYHFETVGTYTIALKTMDSKSRWSAPFAMSLAIDDESLRTNSETNPTTTIAPVAGNTTTPISPGIERDPSEARSGEGSYLISLNESGANAPQLVLSPYPFEGKGVIALWMKASQIAPLEMIFVGKNKDSVNFTESLTLKDYPLNQWFLVTKTIDSKLIDTLIIDFKGSNLSFWVDDISIETIK